MIEFFKPGLYWDFMGHVRGLLGVSIALVVLSIVSIVTLGFNFGIDFAGGYEIQIKLPKAATEAEIKEQLSTLDIEKARVQRFGDQSGIEYLILVREHGTLKEADSEQIKKDFEALAGGSDHITNWSVSESGEILRVGFAQPISEEAVRNVITARELKLKNIHKSDRVDSPEYTIELVSLGGQIANAIVAGLGLPKDTDILSKVEFVGPQVGSQLRNQGIMAVIYSLIFILLYTAIRFDFYFAPGAIVCIVHDVIVTLGFLSVLQIEFTLATVAGLLTLVGYSINDTIVIFDRIRENLTRLRGRELRHLVSTSISDTLSRTILTSVSVLLVVVALLIFSGRALADFSMVLLVGTIVGTYSSMSVAAPCYVFMRERYGKRDKPKANPASAT